MNQPSQTFKRQFTDNAFLQETPFTGADYSQTRRLGGPCILYCSFNSKMEVDIVINKHLMFKLHSLRRDNKDCYIVINCEINIDRTTFVDICGPNHDVPVFFNDLILRHSALKNHCLIGSNLNFPLKLSSDFSLPKSRLPSKAVIALNQNDRVAFL